MELKITSKGDTSVVSLSGSIVGEHSMELSKTLASLNNSEYRNIIIDLSKVEYIDSPGLGGILYAFILLEKNNKQMVLAAPQYYINKLFRDCTIDRKIKIINSIESG
jgi:anti-sigma B factor antagonist